LPFAIADLDGDREPDLALVEMGSQRSARTNYFIRLQLSAGAELAIGVSAPLGGLRVAARDVNGDDNVDLIVTSNLDSRFVQVLINDGHGNFSVAAPGAYPELENESDVFLNPAKPAMDQMTLESLRSSIGDQAVPGFAYQGVLASDLSAIAEQQAVLPQITYSHLGRSPPDLVALS
jgi:hypothetical protein